MPPDLPTWYSDVTADSECSETLAAMTQVAPLCRARSAVAQLRHRNVANLGRTLKSGSPRRSKVAHGAQDLLGLPGPQLEHGLDPVRRELHGDPGELVLPRAHQQDIGGRREHEYRRQHD